MAVPVGVLFGVAVMLTFFCVLPLSVSSTRPTRSEEAKVGKVSDSEKRAVRSEAQPAPRIEPIDLPRRPVAPVQPPITPTAPVSDATPLPDPDTIAPTPRLVRQPGLLRLTSRTAVRANATVWVEVDGKREKAWKEGTAEVELRLLEGEHAVKVVSVYQGVRRTIYDDRVEVQPDRTTSVRVEPPK